MDNGIVVVKSTIQYSWYDKIRKRSIEMRGIKRKVGERLRKENSM